MALGQWSSHAERQPGATPFMRLANHLVSQLPADSRVAFLPFDFSGIQVSQVPDDEDGIAGLSVLVTWPLNILMAHLTLLGIIICLALFPIHGRPQKLPEQAVSDFGQHAEALGQMLSQSRDAQFAAQLSADYLRVVRGGIAASVVTICLDRRANYRFARPFPQLEQAPMRSTKEVFETVSHELHKIFVGQEELVLTTLVALMSGGHILIESLPAWARRCSCVRSAQF